MATPRTSPEESGGETPAMAKLPVEHFFHERVALLGGFGEYRRGGIPS